jgi:hypothetical protein
MYTSIIYVNYVIREQQETYPSNSDDIIMKINIYKSYQSHIY